MMFNFTGHYREEDEWAIGDEWGTNPCGEDTTTTESPPIPNNRDRQRRSQSRRVDMAAMINENHKPFEATEKGIETTELDRTAHEDSLTFGSSDDLKSDDSEGGDWRSRICSCLCIPFSCSPCVARVHLVAFATLALFLTGFGVGMSIHNKPVEQEKSFASANTIGSESGTNMGAGAGVAPVPQPVPGPAGTDSPTPFFDFELDYDNWLPSNDLDGTDTNEEYDGQWDNLSSDLLVGAYYYPWHGENFHNRDGYIRKDLTPQHEPTLGEYNDSDPLVVGQHLAWSRQANIGLWITSWWGPNRLEDSNTKDIIMQHPDLGDLKIALHYETTGRVRGGLTNVIGDMEYMCDNYFDHPNYYKVDDRPVIFVYVTRKLEMEGNLEPTILAMRSAASKCGHDIYLVGDHVFADAPESSEVFVPFWYFDAVTNYDVYGSMGRPSPYAGRAAVDNYYNEQAEWRTSAQANGCRYIPAASPGYNDRGVRLDSNHPPLSRKLTEDSAEGSLFAYQLSKAKLLVDPLMDNLLVVNSFNEWHEDTQIEPAVGERTNVPDYLTQGVYYEGYGELFLNILRESTVSSN